MATPTYDLLDSTTLTSSASSVTFSSISQDYRDLIVVWDVVSASGSGTIQCQNRFNGDSGANYNQVYMGGGFSANSSASSSQNQLRVFPNARVTETIRGLFTLQIMDYSATDKHKSVLGRSAATNDEVTAGAGRWASTAAINSIIIEPTVGSTSFAAGSTFYIYGIAG